MELDKLFEAIDSEILTDEMKTDLTESFETAVEIKAAEMVTEKLEEKETALNEEYEAKLNEYREESTDKINEYLEVVVEQYFKDNAIKIDESIKIKQVDALLEGFDTMLVTAGVDLHRITESTDDAQQTQKIDELTEKVDSLVESNIELKNKNKELFQMGIVKELSEGLTLVQADKFSKLAEVIKIEESSTDYINKLLVLKESVTGEKPADEVNEDDEVNEGNKGGSEELNEDAKNDKANSWSRFV
jgi:hypothetical protein